MIGPGHNRLAELAGEIGAAHRDTITASARAAERAIATGNLLMEAKGLVKHGEWAGWLAANVSEMSERTAQRYMRLARSGLKSATVADLGLRAADEALAELHELAGLTDAEMLTTLGLMEHERHARTVFEFSVLGRAADRLHPGEFERRLTKAEQLGDGVSTEIAFAILRDLTRELNSSGGSPKALS